MTDRLSEIEARLRGATDSASAMADLSREDVAWLVAEVRRLRGLLNAVGTEIEVADRAAASANYVENKQLRALALSLSEALEKARHWMDHRPNCIEGRDLREEEIGDVDVALSDPRLSKLKGKNDEA